MELLTKEYITAAVADCEDVTVEYTDENEVQVWDDQAKAKPLQWLVASA